MPTVNPSGLGPKPQYVLATGLPAVGNLLFFYVGGSTSTKQNTYTDSTGTVANTNPIVLNALGEPTTEIWFAAGLDYNVVYAPAGDTDPPSSPIWTIPHLRGINDSSVTIDQWVNPGLTPTYVSATQFTLAGDQTSAFQAGRRLKTTNSGGTVVSTITVSVFGALTTITVLNDSPGVLDAGLSAVSYGLISRTSDSLPRGIFSIYTLTAEVASTSGTSIDFTGIPSGCQRITIMLKGVSTSGGDNWLFQLGDSGGIEAAGYLGSGTALTNAAPVATGQFTVGFGLPLAAAAATVHGAITLTLENSTTNMWVAQGVFGLSDQATTVITGGSKATSAVLDRVRITTTGGTQTFDAGLISISYEVKAP